MKEISVLEMARCQKELAVKAMGMFISASYLSPASVAAQGARIAEQCKKQGLDPIDLGMFLVSDDQLVRQITRKANDMHHHGNNHAPHVRENHVRDIIRYDFDDASKMMDLDIDLIRDIYTNQYRCLAHLDVADRERRLRNHIATLLKSYSRCDSFQLQI